MLGFVGMGVSGYDGISVEGVRTIKDADIIYVENFTSPVREAEVETIKRNVQGTVRTAARWQVEDGRAIIEEAREKDVVILSPGDPYVATTHIELRVRAESEGIRTFTVHGASAVTAIVGGCGLHQYKVGRTCTIMDDPSSMTTPYYTIYHNVIRGSHSILLLEYDQAGGFFLDPRRALELLLDAEAGQGRGVVVPDTYVIVVSRTGGEQQVVSGMIGSVRDASFGEPPHTIIIPGAMHFTETDALKVLSRCLDPPQEGANAAERISQQMIRRYTPMINGEIDRLRSLYRGDDAADEVFDNARRYIDDARNFMEQGNDEVAVLSIGYADGLVDALRIAKGLEPHTSAGALKRGDTAR